MLQFYQANYATILTAQQLKSKYPLDVENNQENCTPYMLACLREQFSVASYFIDHDLANFQYINKKENRVYDIVRDLKLNKNVQEFLTKQYNDIQQRGQFKNQ